jgi:hypothetical protein
VSKRVSVKAIALGFLAGFAAGAIYSVVVGLFLVAIGREGLDPIFFIISLVGAFGSCFVAGWVAAHLATGTEIENSAVVGAVIVLASAVAYVPLDMGQYPVWYNVLAFLLAIPFSVLGGIARRNRASRNAA